MNTKYINRSQCGAWMLLAMLPASGAMGAVLSATDLADGSFIDVNYGNPAATGLAYVTPYLYAGGLLDTPGNIATTTLLSYSYSFSGLGTSRMQVSYSVTNDDIVNISDAFGELRFIVNVDPNGNLNNDPVSGFNDITSVAWGPKSGGDPDHYQVNEYAIFGGLQDSILANGNLNDSDTDSCIGFICDADFALQWNLTNLGAGETWNITIGLSDDGSALSSRYLQADSADSPAALTFSGVASVIPLPASIVLFASGVLGLAGLTRLRRRG